MAPEQVHQRAGSHDLVAVAVGAIPGAASCWGIKETRWRSVRQAAPAN